MRRWFLVLALVPLLLTVHGASEPSPEEWARPYAPHLPGLEPRNPEGRKTVVSFRVVTETPTGHQPIPGARVAVFQEACGDPTILRTALIRDVQTDAYGFANVAGPFASLAKCLVEAEGFEIVEPFRFGEDDEVELRPAISRRIRILRPFGGPLAGAAVEVFLGCPHSPVAREGVTDENGEILLAGLADGYGQLWIRAAEGVHCGPYDIPERLLGRDLPELITDPGRTERGVVVDPTGAPIAGVVVRALGYRRGPVTTTDEQGRFALHGIWRWNAVGFYRPAPTSGLRPSAVVEGDREDVPLRVVLRDDRPTALADGEARHVADVIVHGPEGRGKREVLVRLVRLSDGFTATGQTGRDWVAGGEEWGRARFEVPAGPYRIAAGGRFTRWREVATTADLPRPGGEPVRLELAGEQPVLRVRGLVEPAPAELRTPWGTKDVQLRAKNGGVARLPPDTPASLVLPAPWNALVVVPPAREDSRFVDPPRPTPNVVRFRAVGPDGRSRSEGWAEIDLVGDRTPLGPDGWTVIRTFAAGSRVLRIDPADPDLDESYVRIELPFEPGTVEVGEVTLALFVEEPTTRSVRLIVTNDEPASADGLDAWDTSGSGFIHLDAGRLRWDLTLEPIHVRIAGEGRYPTFLVLSEETPEEIRLPGGRLRGRVEDPEGQPLEAEIYVDSWRFLAEDGILDIRGVPAGPHIVIVGAEGHLGEVRRLVLTDGETRDLTVVLPPR